MPSRRTLVVSVALSILVFIAAGCPSAQRRPNLPLPQGPFNVFAPLPDDANHTFQWSYDTLAAARQSQVLYDTVSHNGQAAAYPFVAEATPWNAPNIAPNHYRNLVTLRGLTPGATYYAVLGDPHGGYSKEFKFRTLPESATGLRFVDGGDLGVTPEVENMLRLAAAHSPWFAVIGGDISYAPRDRDAGPEWDRWFAMWSRCMVTPDGYTIPMLVTIGNHEVNDEANGDRHEDKAPYYMAYWGKQGERIYFSRRFGQDVAMLFLDAGNLEPHDGAQQEWLKAQLSAMQAYPAKIAVYHQPLYPSYRSYDEDFAKEGRQYWLPLFDEFGLALALEHHDHTFKRTHPLRGGKVAEGGTVYLGDGCWGHDPRSVDSNLRWYLAKAAALSHFWMVDYDDRALHCQAITKEDQVYDAVDIPLKPASTLAPTARP